MEGVQETVPLFDSTFLSLFSSIDSSTLFIQIELSILNTLEEG